MSRREEIRAAARYVRGLRPFLRRALGREEARRRITEQLARRENAFLDLLERSIFRSGRHGGGPYLQLLRHAGVTAGDVRELVRSEGIESALERLYDEGVYVTLDEFRGRRPIRRGSLELEVEPHDFDNPLLARHFEARTSGSRGGVGRRVLVDFDLLTHETAQYLTFLEAFELEGRPAALWRSVPPAADGVKQALRFAKLHTPLEHWFSPNEFASGREQRGMRAFTRITSLVSGPGSKVPFPEHVPFERASHVARWLERMASAGRPALLDTTASSAIRVCRTALAEGIDISGSFFRIGGEPHTEAKDAVIRQAGCRAASHYAMAEVGFIGMACADPKHLDEVHLLTDKIAVIQREASLAPERTAGGPLPRALVYSTVLPSCPRLMLNVESDDFGVLETRHCGCAIGALGLDTHLHRIRSYEKLTSEGVSFLGTELIRLVEEVLPGRFGGRPTDYQLVEEERGGLPRVFVVASPRLGPLDETEVVRTVEKTLSEVPGGSLMIDNWRQGQTLGLERREPHATASAKIQPLHVVAADR